MPDLKTFLRNRGLFLLRRTGLYSTVALRRSSTLADDGWFESFRDHRSTDKAGRPLPWLTYPTIHFLADRISADMSVFEYGAGNSTLWWASRVSSVEAVEHDETYVAEVSHRLPGNATVQLAADTDRYITYPTSTGHRYDIVVIDGEHRDECARQAPAALTDRGVVILDDTEGDRWHEGKRHLAEAGFSHIEFYGLRPMHISQSSTSIFYRDENCLAI